MTLDTEQKLAWERDGFLILPAFYGERELALVDQAVRDVWARRDERVVVDDLVTNRRCLLPALSAEERTHRFKTNDLYLTEPHVRDLALGRSITPILEELLGHTPVLCNSLNFDQGSAQVSHVDSLYMTPRTRGHLCAIWVALEDASPQAGPLFYYPGSHKLTPYVFSDGGYHAIDAEMPAWESHIQRQLQQRGLSKEVFHAKRGDVFIWSSDLVHGGSPIEDPSKTRKSVVFHYLSQSDCKAVHSPMEAMNGAYWLVRARQPVPEDRPSTPKKSAGRDSHSAELRRLQGRIAKLEAEVSQLKKDPLRIRKRASRMRRRILSFLAPDW